MASSQIPSDQEVIDLVDIGLLLHHGMSTTYPLVRGGKLLEVAYPGEQLTTVKLSRGFGPTDGRSQTNILFQLPQQQISASSASAEPDLPSNMLTPENLIAYPKLNLLTPKQRETLFYQARGFNACFTTVGLLQRFLRLFSSASTRLIIRHVPAKGSTEPSAYTTTLDTFRIVEQTLTSPQFCTAVILRPSGTAHVSRHVSGDEPTLCHAVAAFAPPGATELTSFLDLSSMQFGDVGRGLGGSGLFALDTLEEFEARTARLGKGLVDEETKVSHAIGLHPEEGWLQGVAARAKERWDKRHKEKWCGHCGAPVSMAKTCAGCGAAWYCGRDHQKMAWGLHKHYCAKK